MIVIDAYFSLIIIVFGLGHVLVRAIIVDSGGFTILRCHKYSTSYKLIDVVGTLCECLSSLQLFYVFRDAFM